MIAVVIIYFLLVEERFEFDWKGMGLFVDGV